MFSLLGAILLCHCIQSQTNFTIAVGANVASAPLKELNFVVNEYNEVRPYLERPMPEIHLLRGPDVSLGLQFGSFLGEFRFSYLHATQWAFAPSTGAANQRELKIRANTIGYGISYRLTNKIPVFLGAMLDVGPIKVFTRVGVDEAVKDLDWTEVLKKHCLVFTPNALVKLPFSKQVGLAFRLFTKLYISRASFAPYREIVNPVQSDPTEELKGRASSVGGSMQLYLQF